MIPSLETDTAETLQFEEWFFKATKNLPLRFDVGKVNDTIYLQVMDNELIECHTPDTCIPVVRYNSTSLDTIKEFTKVWISISKLSMENREIIFKNYESIN